MSTQLCAFVFPTRGEQASPKRPDDGGLITDFLDRTRPHREARPTLACVAGPTPSPRVEPDLVPGGEKGVTVAGSTAR